MLVGAGAPGSSDLRRLTHGQLVCMLEIALLVAAEAPAQAPSDAVQAPSSDEDNVAQQLRTTADKACQCILDNDPFAEYEL